MRALLILAVLAAFLAGGWSAVSFLAPEIQSDVAARAAGRVLPIATHRVGVETRGRHVTVRGIAQDTAERDAMIAEAEATVGQVEVIDRLEVLEIVQPFAFTAIRREDGQVALTGVVPSAEARKDLIEAARIAAGDNPVRADLALAAGVPSDAWLSHAETAISALRPLDFGTARIADLTGRLTGTVDGVERRAEVRAILAANGAGTWETDLDLLLPTASPYRFEATKEPARYIWKGNAPNDTVLARLSERAEAMGGKGATGTITLADGMPHDAWPETVERGLGSLALLRSGTLAVEDTSVVLTGVVETSDDLGRFETTLAEDWEVDISVLSPDPAPRLEILLEEDGTVTFTGRTPKSFDLDLLGELFANGSTDDLETDGTGDETAWASAVDALGIIAPRMRSLRATFTDGRLELTGVLKRDFPAIDARAALNAAIPAGWQAEIDLRDAPPFPRLTFLKAPDGIRLTGILPDGISINDARDRTNAVETDLKTGGDGLPDPWAEALSLTARIASAYDRTEAVLSDATLTMEGALAPGQTVAEVTAWSKAALPESWALALSGTETPAEDGTVRFNFGSDEFELRRRGYWLPELDFDVAPEACDAISRTALETEKITFVTGSTEIDDRARHLLNRLSSVVLRCLDGTGLSLEIAGHTDDVGADDRNLLLSEQRALAVLNELLFRGISAAGLSAAGYGETRPVADNATEEGRAANRRIEFSFTE